MRSHVISYQRLWKRKFGVKEECNVKLWKKKLLHKQGATVQAAACTYFFCLAVCKISKPWVIFSRGGEENSTFSLKGPDGWAVPWRVCYRGVLATSLVGFRCHGCKVSANSTQEMRKALPPQPSRFCWHCGGEGGGHAVLREAGYSLPPRLNREFYCASFPHVALSTSVCSCFQITF